MLRTLLFISLVIVLIGCALGFTKFQKTVPTAPYAIDENAQRQILAATVRISLFAPITDAQGNPQYVTVNGQTAVQYTVGEGLGTLTRSGQDVVIVTHDHWTLLTPNLHKVQFHNVANELLLELSGQAFQQSIRYRDGGTMVLSAPRKLISRLTPAGLGDGTAVQNNNVVLIAFRQPYTGNISVTAMRVEKVSSYEGQSVYRMTSLHGESIVGGNSGGGVWADGQLVGNMWTTTMEQEVSRITGEVTSKMTETSTALAAQLPAALPTLLVTDTTFHRL